MKAKAVNLKSSEIRILDEIFNMSDGYVLDFSNPTFANFFHDELDVDINDPKYLVEGASKAKRLRYFLRTSEASLVLAALVALWEYREAISHLPEIEELPQNIQSAFSKMVQRLGGDLRLDKNSQVSAPKIEPIAEAISMQLSAHLMEITSLAPQRRGYAYEEFLKKAFDAYGLSGKSSFRIMGEQIDGSFQMGDETYLLEAKWQNELTGAADLHTFEGKLGQKAAWSRGLFVSNSGFTNEGIQAFGRGKRLVCMDGFDISEMLRLRISLADVIAAKVRAAAETGSPFVRVRDLFH